jgi:hypothetical protein
MSKAPVVTKKSCQKHHFKTRLLERYGLSANKSEYTDLCFMIRNNHPDVVHLLRQSHRVAIKWLPFKGKMVVVAYDNLRNTLITALPPECRDLDLLYPYCNSDDTSEEFSTE